MKGSELRFWANETRKVDARTKYSLMLMSSTPHMKPEFRDKVIKQLNQEMDGVEGTYAGDLKQREEQHQNRKYVQNMLKGL